MSFIGVLRSDLDEFPSEMDMEKDDVVFKIHTKGHFEYDPLRLMNINGHYSTVYQKNHLTKVAHKKQHLEWEEDDAGLRCCSSTPFDTRYKRKISKSKKTGVIHDEGAGRKRKKSLVNGGNKGKEKVFEDEGADKKLKKTLVNGGSKGKENVFEDEGADIKRNKTLVNGGSKGKEKVFEDEGNQGVVTIYKRAMVNGKAKMVEVEGAVKTGRDRGVVIGGKEEVVKVESE
ncbi:hypothetical protein Tco_0997912 [Tanacetum coccineum]